MNHPTTPPERSLLDLTVRELLDLLASDAPAPGGGAAAALVGALGAALVEMTANLTVGRPKLADVEAQARETIASAGALRRFFEKAVDEDATAFAGVSAAYRLPKDSDADRATRSAAIQAALASAADAPLEVARRSAELLRLAEQTVGVLNPAVVSDVVVGAILGHAALRGAAENVEVNLGMLKDASIRDPLARALAEATDGAEERTRRVVEAGKARMR